jgi:tetratricopeptide (TPR) repeat protein
VKLGSIALEQGNYAQARTIFSLATERPEPAIRQAALSGLGDVELYLGHTMQARDFFQKAVEIGTDDAAGKYALYQIGRIDLQAGALSQAASVFEKLVSDQDQVLADHARLALVITYLNQKEDAKAKALLQDIQQTRPNARLAARAAYYEALLALGEDQEIRAEQLCQQLIAKAPTTEEAFEARLLLADLKARKTSQAEVMAWLKQTYDTERLTRSQQAKLAKRIGEFAKADGQYLDAISWYARSAELLPSLESESAYRIGSCHEELGDMPAALTWYRKVAQEPWRVRGQLAVAKLMERQEQWTEAQAIYEALADEPIPEAKLIRERLAALRNAETKEKP